MIVAKHAGFCFGVRRAVELAEETARAGLPCVMLGSIIHNRDVVDRKGLGDLWDFLQGEEAPTFAQALELLEP